MCGKSRTYRRVTRDSASGLRPRRLAVRDRLKWSVCFRQVIDLPRIGMAEPFGREFVDSDISNCPTSPGNSNKCRADQPRYPYRSSRHDKYNRLVIAAGDLQVIAGYSVLFLNCYPVTLKKKGSIEIPTGVTLSTSRSVLVFQLAFRW